MVVYLVHWPEPNKWEPMGQGDSSLLSPLFMTRLSNTDDLIEVGDDSLVSLQEEILAPVAALILTVSGIWAEDFPSQEPLAVDPVLHRQ